MSRDSQDVQLSLSNIRQFRHLLWAHEENFHSYPEQNETTRQILKELHNLAVDIQNIFNSSFVAKESRSWRQSESGTTTLKSRPGKAKEQESQIYLSKKNEQGVSITPIKPQTKFIDNDSPLHNNFQREDNYHQDSIVKSQYKEARTSIQQLQKQKRSLLNKLEVSSKKLQDVTKEKKYCIDLLNKNSVKESDMEIENKVLRNQTRQLNILLKQLQQQNKNLTKYNEEKSLLLKDIDDFLTNNQNTPTSRRFQAASRIKDQNSKLISEIVQYQQQLSILYKQRACNQTQITELVMRNEDLMNQIERFQDENQSFKLKNQELINIEESKKLNDIVHKENRHLLQMNYQLGNKIYAYEREVQKLIQRIMDLEDNQSSNRAGDTPNYEQYAISTNPSASKGVCLDEHFPLNKVKSVTQIKNYSSAQSTINQLNNKLKNQTNLNSELQDKIEQLLDQLYVCQKSIFEKQKQIANLNLSLNRTETMHNIPTTQLIESQQKYQIHNLTSRQQQQQQSDEILTLQELVHKFQPSLMDTLFIMLRITEIAVIMLQEGCAKTIIPCQLLLQLDQPNKPQNIIIQLKSNENQDTQIIHFYQSPQMIIGQEISQASIVWNLGMIFYYLICKEPYFKSVKDIEQTDGIQFRKSLIPEVEIIIEYALRRNPQIRISLDELLEAISQQINKIFSQY